MNPLCSSSIGSLEMNCLPIESNSLDFRIHVLIEDVFKFTVDKDHVTGTKLQPLVYLEKTADVCKKPWMDVDTFEYALGQRLLLGDCFLHVINVSENLDSRVTLNECVTYLFECYEELISYQNDSKNENEDWARTIDHIIKLIVRNAATALKQPDLYVSQDIHTQVINVFSKNNITHLDKLIPFFKLVAAEIRGGNDSFDSVCQSMEPILVILREQIKSGSIHNLPIASLNTLEAFAKIPEFALAVVKDSIVPYDEPASYRYPTSILGMLFSLPSKLLDHSMAPEEYSIENSIYGNIEFMGQQLWPSLEILSVRLHRIFLSFLETSSHVRDVLLKWIHGCVKHNGRHSMKTIYKNFIWTGFELTLCSVLLRFCVPFIKSTNFPELLTINPTYDFFKDMADVLVAYKIRNFFPREEPYLSNTEYFLLAHCALELCLKKCLNELTVTQLEVNQKRRISKKYPKVFGNWDELPTRTYNTLGTILFEPSFIDNLADFLRATCTWLVQLSFNPNQSHEQNLFTPLQSKNLNIELLSPPDTSKYMLKFLLENLCSYLILLSRHYPIALERIDNIDFLEPVFTAIIIYTGSNRLAHYPFLRCQLAKCILCLIPLPARMYSTNTDEEIGQMNFSDQTYKLLNNHTYRDKVIPSILNAIYGSEHEFEININDSTSYQFMCHLWTLEDQKQVFKRLAVEAEQNMEAVNPSPFLQFINTMLEDAGYYLEEVLHSMEEIQLAQAANEETESVSEDERKVLEKQDKDEQFAIFTNIHWMDTIIMLEYLTEEIKSIFCHNSVVNEVADILIDHLIYLVGPKKNNFAIENMDEYKFDPATIVRRICTVYVNLGCNGIFRVAVGRDGRVSQLLHQAADFLMQSKSVKLGNDLDKLSRRVEELAKQIESMPDILSEAPDDFLDEITSTLMIDPVILPSSGLVVDRWTAEKWLSENETDPYNRLPLTIDMVQPDVKLKEKIKEWIEKNK